MNTYEIAEIAAVISRHGLGNCRIEINEKTHRIENSPWLNTTIIYNETKQIAAITEHSEGGYMATSYTKPTYGATPAEALEKHIKRRRAAGLEPQPLH